MNLNDKNMFTDKNYVVANHTLFGHFKRKNMSSSKVS